MNANFSTEVGGLKGRFPFRLGTTSYIYPDEIIYNVRRLHNKVDDIELVLFESDEISNYPDIAEIEALKDISENHDLTFSIHLPLDISLGDEDEHTRRLSVAKCARAIEATYSLEPYGYIIHFQNLPANGIKTWQKNHRRSMAELARLGLPSHLFCVETLNYPFRLVEGIIREFDLSICLDVGHVFLYGQPLGEYLERYLPSTRIIHLHGHRNGRDHRHLGTIPDADLALLFSNLFQRCRGEDLLLTLEVFSERDLDLSLAVVEKFCR